MERDPLGYLSAAFKGGVEEVVVRVSRYDDDLLLPVRFQAIARLRDATRPWLVRVDDTPQGALAGCLAQLKLRAAKPADPDLEDLLS